ncbi:MAG: diacylglycerol kinase family protein [Chloroflexota bacterium]
MSQPRPVFIINPVAGGGRGRRAQATITEFLGPRTGTDAQFAVTERPGHAVDLARDAAASGFDPIVAVGGDGTVHEVANGLLGFGGATPRLAVIPIGTGNDFARSVGIPADLRAAVKVASVVSGRTRIVDQARCGDRYFVVLVGTGFAARVAKAVNESPSWSKIGALPFVYHTLREVLTNRNVELTITLDGKDEIHQPSFMVYVSNCRFSGGGMQLSPEARPDDGLLDVCLVGDASRRDVVTMLPKVFSGRHVGHPKVSLHRATTIRVDGPSHVEVQADGEVIGALPMEVAVVPNALRVLVSALTNS